ncbi:hypothetical protein BARBAKC583_1168 [Bartonella bacilliformis KC583]|uniref:Uncharacterized protein n=1 Tax=Bartonella bacilliformis (strain ATCC 35685 / KC583 / Herrer 020/F12,63) TaxID=360095 RepID=A1UTX4_BARBK|nr:hypothetical protein BARBAKC583_1168 [Bartonella bacilliformis KC583]
MSFLIKEEVKQKIAEFFTLRRKIVFLKLCNQALNFLSE